MDHISSCRKALGQWKREMDLNAAKLVNNLYFGDDATIDEIGEALKELTDALKAEEQF